MGHVVRCLQPRIEWPVCVHLLTLAWGRNSSLTVADSETVWGGSGRTKWVLFSVPTGNSHTAQLQRTANGSHLKEVMLNFINCPLLFSTLALKRKRPIWDPPEFFFHYVPVSWHESFMHCVAMWSYVHGFVVSHVTVGKGKACLFTTNLNGKFVPKRSSWNECSQCYISEGPLCVDSNTRMYPRLISSQCFQPNALIKVWIWSLRLHSRCPLLLRRGRVRFMSKICMHIFNH